MALYDVMYKEGKHAGKINKLPFPETREAAIAAGLTKYWPGVMCPICKDPESLPIVYVKSGKNGCCVHREAVKEYNAAVIDRGEPITPQEAMQRGFDFYWSPLAFQKCGHVGKTTLKGTCYHCKHARENSPRQIALKNNETWYMPDSDDKCPKCGVVAPRRVSNGSCKNCEDQSRPDKVEAESIHKTNPDMTLTRAEAIAGGFKVYRTGKPCKYGHTGWRYVSTGACLSCKERE